MKIRENFIGDNANVVILSNNGIPTVLPQPWGAILDGCEVMVAIPDMHIYINDDPMDNFKWVADTMIDFLQFLGRRKDELDLDGRLMRIYQLGDMYELRFPWRNRNASVDDIRMSSDKYSRILNMIDTLEVNKVYGNHDFENRHFQGYKFAYKEGLIYLEHGFAADTWLANPNERLWDPAMMMFLGVKELNAFFAGLAVDLKIIPKDSTFSIGVKSAEHEVIGIASNDQYREKFEAIKNHYCSRLARMKDAPEEKYRIAIVGHTHTPHFDDTEDDGEIIYVDAGGWTEGRSTFVVATNEEIALCHYRRV